MLATLVLGIISTVDLVYKLDKDDARERCKRQVKRFHIRHIRIYILIERDGD